MIRIFFKLITLFIFVALIPVLFVSYEFFNIGNKIFENNNNPISIAKQFSDMIFSPARSLKGESDDSINILLLGVGGKHHNGGDLTDTIMIAKIKPLEKEAAFISIPRDLFVHVKELGIGTKINAVKALGDKSGKDGNELLKNIIKEITGQNLNYFIQLDFDGFIKIINDVGGIDIELEYDINDPSYPDFNNGYDPFRITKGFHHLDGATALKVARSRHSKMGDFDRIKRQQEIMISFRQKLYEKYSSVDIMAFKNILIDLGNHLSTDIEPREIPRFYNILKGISSHKITADTLDTSNYLSRSYIGLGYTLEATNNNYENIRIFSENIFEFAITDDEKKSIEREKATIEIRNASSSPDAANNVSRDLELYGFRIIKSANVTDGAAIGVKIFDNSEGRKSSTLQILKDKFSAILKNETPVPGSRADFVILLGKGF